VRIVVVGGGLTGLATAWHLRDRAEVTLLERGDRVGGQVRTITLADAPLDVGADAFLARHPHAERLARAVGFGDDDLVAPATGQVNLWVRGRLRPLPTGTVMGVPTDPVAVARAGVLSPTGAARAALEPAIPRRAVVGDRSVADLIGERFGREVVDTLVEPLLGGVYAGSTDRLSAAAALAPVWAASRRSRSLTVGLRAHRAATADASGPLFRTVRGGLTRLSDRLRDQLGDRVRRATPAVTLRRTADGEAWEVGVPDGAVIADRVVLAVPARVAAGLLASVTADAARELAMIRTASVATASLAYARGQDVRLPDASGVLVPRREGGLVKAVTFATRKWPHHADREALLVRASVGRVDDDRALAYDDEEFARHVDAEVRAITGLPRPAAAWFVQRWPEALPQYDVGHHQRVDRIRHAAGIDAPGVHVAGASLDGLGLAARAREAEQIADQLLP
jgi:oxygen-dependent protoporphyrinogen oxidase